MSDPAKNKLAARIIKAEMMNDQATVARLRLELSNLSKPSLGHKSEKFTDKPSIRMELTRQSPYPIKGRDDGKVKKFLDGNSSLSQMFVQEKKITASDEVKMFLKTSSKLSRDLEDTETKHFSEEIDASQSILEKSNKRRKQQGPQMEVASSFYRNDTNIVKEICDRCLERQAKHLIVDKLEFVYLTLDDTKPILSSMSNVIIRNRDHPVNSFISASHDIQSEVETLIKNLRSIWGQRGYRTIMMETHMTTRRPAKKEFAGNHFQVHCLPIKEKHFERARMCFKQALQSSEGEWSLNRKLVITDGRKVHRLLPRGLSYFWVCFDELSNGFGHVIENVNNFSRYFGLEVLSSLLDRDFNPMRLDRGEDFKEQFERCRDFKMMYFKKQD